MGSFFLHDDYRLPDLANALPFKKDNTSANGIFENNPCFASIKKELGFIDDSWMFGDDDLFGDTKARSSPVVERLILQEVQNEIADYAVSIGIPIDPEQWSREDTKRWLRWVATIYHVGDLSEFLNFEGTTLCTISEQEFILLTGSEDTGRKIAAQLDLWKNATRMTPSAGFYHFQQQQAMDFKFGIPQDRSDAGTPKLLEASCSWNASNQPSASAAYNMGQFTNTSNCANSTPFETYNFPNYNNYYSNMPQEIGSSQQEVRYQPRPTIPLDRFGCYRAVCQTEGFSAAQSYQRYTSFSYPNTFQNTQSENKNFVQNLPKEYLSVPAAAAAEDKTYTSDVKQSMQVLAMLDTSEGEMKTESSSSAMETINNIKVEKESDEESESCVSDYPECKAASTTVDPAVKLRKKSSKHPIHLWEFLKQLLNEGKDCIKWLDQEKGVFKIYNSQLVAKYWGERKNRPAMNYDKLSRSIRQYYKKGIIKKTSQGKRLVYQFCDAYI